MEKLKRCPFCGSYPQVQAMKVTYCQLHGEPSQDFKVRCSVCNIDIVGRNAGHAIEKWNTRKLESPN